MIGTSKPHGVAHAVPLTSTMRRSTEKTTDGGPFALLVEREPRNLLGRATPRTSQKEAGMQLTLLCRDTGTSILRHEPILSK